MTQPLTDETLTTLITEAKKRGMTRTTFERNLFRRLGASVHPERLDRLWDGITEEPRSVLRARIEQGRQRDRLRRRGLT